MLSLLLIIIINHLNNPRHPSLHLLGFIRTDPLELTKLVMALI